MALRVVPLPQFVTELLRAKRKSDDDPEWPVFAAAGRDGVPTYRWPSNVRRSVRTARSQVGLDWMTPHTWRRTYATIWSAPRFSDSTYLFSRQLNPGVGTRCRLLAEFGNPVLSGAA
jgi:integrase